jgi:hypothetical protein
MEDPRGQVFDKTNSDRVTSVNGCIKAWACIYQGISSRQQETLIGETRIREKFSTKRKLFHKTLLDWEKVCRDEVFTEQPSIQNKWQ